MDLVGPFAPSVGKRRYFLTIVDDHSRFGFVFPLMSKSETLTKFKEFCNLVQNQHKVRVKKILTDRGTEFNSNQFSSWLRSKGIVHLRTVPYSKFQNGIAEQRSDVLQTMMRCALEDSGLDFAYWVEAVRYANYTLNRVWSSVVQKTPYEVLYGHKPSLAHLHVFGVMADVHVPKEIRRKGDRISVKLRFVGYEQGSKAFRFAYPNGKLMISRSATFHEGANWSKIHANEILTRNPSRSCRRQSEDVSENLSDDRDTSGSGKRGTQTPLKGILKHKMGVARKDRHPASETHSDSHEVDDSSDDSDVSDTPRGRPVRATRGNKPRRYDDFVTSVDQVLATPQRYEDVLALPDHERQKWLAAMDTELDSLKRLDVFMPTRLPKDKRVIGTRWLFKQKPIEGGGFVYKARLVAQGFSQRFPDDYEDTFSPTVRPESMRTALIIATMRGEHVYQFDIQTAYLHAQLDKELYVRILQGVSHREDDVWLLNKSLYGLKQSGKRWYECLTKSLREMGFLPSSADECVFVKEDQGIRETILLYVDDILYICRSENRHKKFSEDLSKSFALKPLGHISKFLGVQFVKTEKGFRLSQEDKIKELLKKCSMVEAKPCDTPMATDFLKNMYTESTEFEDKTLYKSVIGLLLYIARCDCLDATYYHVWWTCKKVKAFWIKIWWVMQNVLKKKDQFSPQLFLLGIVKGFTSGETKLILYMITAARLLIGKYWKNEALPTIEEWTLKMASFAEMAKISAYLKDCLQETYEWKWKKWIDYVQNKYQTRKYQIVFI
ncbi:uncharacterized protein LOC117676053 [Pantherophis guttatus]|uniref:Uncharacterized protein LOC117676053 n=1 Tax=Pantherophis guttatus TaxID=94885 RepID=A0ABM3Z2S1_PANGU|nr:uncharacterized protein LOC117676053 [Pantherophis guttatus]XP_060542667.1 uncharacterized protein LOC117676053 [Pantherophis guttatus]XP_060542668.1 uncharacterized protein LOC117676053 [Pantherophis guttatus]XP_060542670.1 uncharacterized protein LOC117676053 [Pantherophis guttatus]XP_060542671.1 uncharacterized protein LOC117676053 [Pantherophis guttatus]